MGWVCVLTDPIKTMRLFNIRKLTANATPSTLNGLANVKSNIDIITPAKMKMVVFRLNSILRKLFNIVTNIDESR